MGQWRGELLWWEYARKRRKWGFPLPPPRQTAAMAQSSLKLPRVLAKDTGGRSVLLCGALGTSARLRTQRPADPESWSRPAGLVTGWIRVGLPLLTAAFLSGFCFRGLWGHRGKPGSQEPLCLVLLQLNTPSCPQSMPSACTALAICWRCPWPDPACAPPSVGTWGQHAWACLPRNLVFLLEFMCFF